MRYRRITWSPLTFAPMFAIGAANAWMDKAWGYCAAFAAVAVLSLAVWLLVPAKERM